MKIVDDKTAGWTMAVRCEDCGSTLEIEETDVRIGEFGSWDGPGERLPYVVCSVCKRDVRVQVPSWVYRRALDRFDQGKKP